MDVLADWIEKAEPWHWAAVGGGAMLLIGILIFLSRSGPKTTFTGLGIRLFQIAPLGRDAFLTLYNPAEAVTLSQYSIVGRDDILVKNHVAGQRLPTGGEYRILMEAAGQERLTNDFFIELVYVVESQQQAYRQRLIPAESRGEKPRRV